MSSVSLPQAPAARWLGPLLVFGGGACIGFAPIGLRIGLDYLEPQAIAFWRYVFATPILFLIVLAVKRRLPVMPNRFVLMAGTFFALDIGIWHAALTFTTVANATFVVNLGNVGVGILAWIFLKDRPSRVWAVAVCVAVSGAAFLTFGGGTEGQTDLRGDALALIAATLLSGYMLCVKIARRDIGALDVLFWVTAVEAVVSGLMTIVAGEGFWPTPNESGIKDTLGLVPIVPATLIGWLAPLFLALAVQVGGQGLIIAGLGRTPAAIAGVLVLIQPVIAAAISWQLFNEPLVALQFFGAGLILLGVGLAQFGESARKGTDSSSIGE